MTSRPAFFTTVLVYRVSTAILIACYLALGSGAMERWHNVQHAIEDAALIVAVERSGAPAQLKG